jgi:hypothetical protein
MTLRFILHAAPARFLCALIMISFFKAAWGGVPINADTTAAMAIITPVVELLEDTGAELTPGRITDASFNTRFSPIGAALFYSPWSTSAFWMRYKLSNASDRSIAKIIAIDCQFIDTLATYIEENGSLRLLQKTGRHFAFDQRPEKSRTFCVYLQVPPRDTQTLYHRIKSTEVITAVAYLWDPEAFFSNQRSILLLYGMIYGLSGAVLCATLVLSVLSRKSWYLYYGLMLVFMHILFTMGRQGVSQMYLFPSWPIFATLIHLSFACVGQIFSLLLTQSFLRFGIRSGFWKGLFYGQIAILAAATVLPFIIGYRPISVFLTYFSCLSFFTILAMSIIAVVRGNRSAIFFLIAWICHLAGASTILLRSWGLLSDPLIMDHGYQIGIALELVLISIAMAYQMFVQRRENNTAREHLLATQKISIDNLRKSILSRIQERQARVNPDFLFNALNTISHETKTDPQAANRDLGLLSDFYRLVLGFSRRSFVDLSEEIESVRLYMHFEKLRFGDRIGFSMEVDDGLDKIQAPGLVLQPLVENAVEQNVLQRISGGNVAVSVHRNAGWLTMSVVDCSSDGQKPAISPDCLANIKERLELLYSDNFLLDLKNDGGVVATILIPIRAVGDPGFPMGKN